MAAFNVSVLNDFEYPETTHFIDPMEPRYRAKPILPGEFVGTGSWGTGEFSLAGVKDKGDWFSNLDAYTNVPEIEDALEAYWNTKTNSPPNPTSIANPNASPIASPTSTSVLTTAKASTTLSRVTTSSSSPAATSSSTGNSGKGGGKRPRRNARV